MARQFYYFAIFFFVVLIFQEVLIITMLMIVGKAVYSVGSFIPYFILVSATQACCSIITLLYCYRYRYIWPFWASWLSVVSLSTQTAVVYEILIHHNFQSWYYSSLYAASGANLLLGISLILSGSSTRFWLKWIGIASICVDTVQIILLIWYTEFADFQMKAMLGQVNIALSWLMIATTGLWVIHFVREAKSNNSFNKLSWSSLAGFTLVSLR